MLEDFLEAVKTRKSSVPLARRWHSRYWVGCGAVVGNARVLLDRVKEEDVPFIVEGR